MIRAEYDVSGVGRKKERASCIPLAKIGERPYLAPPLSRILDPFLAQFSGSFRHRECRRAGTNNPQPIC